MTNLLPFDLEAAKAGAEVITTQGRPVTIYDWEFGIDDGCILVGKITHPYGDALERWTLEGKISRGIQHPNDLRIKPKTETVWYALLRPQGRHPYLSTINNSQDFLKDLSPTIEVLALHSIDIPVA